MAGHTIASYQLLLYLLTFIVVGEILCQGPAKLPTPPQPSRARAVQSITARNNANAIGGPSKQSAGKQPSKPKQNGTSNDAPQQQQQQQQQLSNASTTAAPQPQVASVKDLFNSASCVEPPFTCPHPKIQFFLYTRLTQNDPELLNVTDPESLYASHFNPEHPVKIIIHGFQGGRNLSPSTDLRNAYFTRSNYNIIIVDYSSLAQIPCLNQVDWAPRFCAMCIAQLANYLAEHPRGVPPDKLHMMGYSVGAHIAGLTANFIESGKIGRITGLDPTIIFYMNNNRSRDLDPTDAHFVDIIHTAAGILGQWGPSGHADFYVNGGTSQPGCASDSIIHTLSCDHTKVTPYFIESINSNTGFWALPCSNRFYFSLGLCDPPLSEYVLMGEHVTHKARGIYYLTTNAKKPYARGFPDRPSAANRLLG